MAVRGGCLCGGVRYEIVGDLGQPNACHCSQCARTSGNFAVMARARASDLRLVKAGPLTWYRSSEPVRRGFCGVCGSNLFWTSSAIEDEIYVTAGTLDAPTGVRLAEHIFVESKSDFYEITDGLPQKPRW